MSAPVRHIRRAFAPVAECRTDSTDILVDSPTEATCDVCKTLFERRQADWLRALELQLKRPRFGPKKRK